MLPEPSHSQHLGTGFRHPSRAYMGEPFVIHLVPHTHWDREWCLPFPSFRMRLLDLVDQVLETLEADPRFAFTLDGQLDSAD